MATSKEERVKYKGYEIFVSVDGKRVWVTLPNQAWGKKKIRKRIGSVSTCGGTKTKAIAQAKRTIDYWSR